MSRNIPAPDAAVLIGCGGERGQSRCDERHSHEARMVGTVRTFSPVVQEQIVSRMQEVMDGIAAAFKARITMQYRRLFPATINTPHHAELVADVAKELFGEESVESNLVPSMGSEDFSFMLQQRPGAYFRLGQGGAESGCVLHNARYDFNDEVIPHGVAMFARLVERSMPLAQD